MNFIWSYVKINKLHDVQANLSIKDFFPWSPGYSNVYIIKNGWNIKMYSWKYTGLRIRSPGFEFQLFFKLDWFYQTPLKRRKKGRNLKNLKGHFLLWKAINTFYTKSQVGNTPPSLVKYVNIYETSKNAPRRHLKPPYLMTSMTHTCITTWW